MKHLSNGRSKTLAGKRKPKSKPAGAKPNASRQRQIAARKRTRRANEAKRLKTAARRAGEAETAATTAAAAVTPTPAGS